ncbi:polysaccharide pyruvyl transferase family protein [uncultured Duncaniella sp.]|uniref:polysaccharide pyruvyl transferase family protein n=1 Tax=uncultured Duncaniella sp. TaxID=2768039 RepID=UPI00272D1501|nr:polysaccharide pyruvyl transferase family protein [uncultured Duncaniella sp.]
MKNIGIITFHAAHNYGSMLQNYALQQAIMKLSDKYYVETINMRSIRQIEQYNYFKAPWKYQDKKRILLSILYAPFFKALKMKYRLFEEFLANNISLSMQVDELSENTALSKKYDAIIAGSDQIWNITAYDFSWNYFLDFIHGDIRKISYAASMGTAPASQMQLYMQKKEFLRELLNSFYAISVREQKTASAISSLTDGKIRPEVVPDPTLLLSSKEWESLVPSESIVRGEYIFLYNPYYLSEVYTQAMELKKATGLPVVVSNINTRSIIPSIRFNLKLCSGPIEFLNLVKNAKYVIGKSFHLAVFSTLFSKNFIAVNGMNDSRLNNYLSKLDICNIASNGKITSELIDASMSIQ